MKSVESGLNEYDFFIGWWLLVSEWTQMIGPYLAGNGCGPVKGNPVTDQRFRMDTSPKSQWVRKRRLPKPTPTVFHRPDTDSLGFGTGLGYSAGTRWKSNMVYLYCVLYFNHNVSWEPEGRYCRSKMFRWEPEGRYCHWLWTAIAPFWFSMEHLWAAITPFWLSTDDIV